MSTKGQATAFMDKTQKQTLLANFMGLKIHESHYLSCQSPTRKDKSYETMIFNCDWKWLMTVVHKCLTICHEEALNEWENAFSDTFLSMNIETMFDLCVDFVIWVKEQNLTTLAEKNLRMKKEIELILLGNFSTFGMDKPINFDDIVEFCYEDVKETADPNDWHSGDVVIAFRRWIESQIPEVDN